MNYRLYKRAWIYNDSPHTERHLTSTQCDKMLKMGGVIIRNLFDFDTNETEFWYVIKDRFEGINETPSKHRGRLRKAIERFDCKIVDKEYILQHGYQVYVRAAEKYRVKYTPPTEEEFRARINLCDGRYDLWACIDKETGKLAAFAINHVFADCVDYQTTKFDPEMMSKLHCSYGLIYEMNRYYLEELKMKYVSDGARSLTNHSDVQPFLIEKFKFRKAYCRMAITYKWWFGLLVKAAYPFRNYIPSLSVRSILKMEEINRTFKNNDKTIQML